MKKLRKTVLLLVAAAFAGIAAQVIDARPAKVAVKVAAVGDSITEGSGTTKKAKHSYPAQLQELLGAGYEVKNFGIGGRTLLKNGDYPYWTQSKGKFEASQKWQPDIVVIQLGTNDTKPWNWKYKSQFVDNYVEMVHVYRNLPSHPVVYICYPPTVYPNHSPAFHGSDALIAKEMIPMIDEVAELTGAKVIDNHSASANMPGFYPDGVHPSNEGAGAIAHEVYKTLLQLMSKETTVKDNEKAGSAVSKFHK